MRLRFFIAALLLVFVAGAANAQEYIEGKVVDASSLEGIGNVFIKNVTNNKITIADDDGEFEIPTAVGNLLIFTSPGYLPDTLLVVSMSDLNVKLQRSKSLLKEVNVSSTRDSFDPRTEYPEVYTKSKVYILSPSSLFGKEAKNARRLKKYFEQEERERVVDQAFSAAYVSTIVPLKGVELQTFMAMYRPSYEFVTANSGPSMASYINDSYKKYKELPPEKRRQATLTD